MPADRANLGQHVFHAAGSRSEARQVRARFGAGRWPAPHSAGGAQPVDRQFTMGRDQWNS